MANEDLKRRTKRFALSIIKLVEALPPGRICDVLGKQLLRSGTSVGANYRAACRAKSKPDFISKLGNVEEADESSYWMELLHENGKVRREQVGALIQEANDLLAITIASINTARTSAAAVRMRNDPNVECGVRNPG